MELGKLWIRTVTRDDLGFVLGLMGREGWGYTRKDLERLLGFRNAETFVAMLGEERVGVVTTTLYPLLSGGYLGWIGNMVVEPGHRCKGIGSWMVRRVVEMLREKGVVAVKLYAYEHRLGFYGRIGFDVGNSFLRFVGFGGKHFQSNVFPLSHSMVEKVAQLDREYFGADRKALLDFMVKEFPGSSFYGCSCGELCGFVIGRFSTGGCEVGPWICDPRSPDVGRELLRAVLSGFSSMRVEMTIPEGNSLALRIAREHGFVAVQRVFEMRYRFLGRCSNDLSGVFAVGSLEMG